MESELFIPKKECTCLDYMTNLSLIIGGFKDSFIRFFAYTPENLQHVASLELEGEITKIRIIPQTKNFLASDNKGNVYMVYI